MRFLNLVLSFMLVSSILLGCESTNSDNNNKQTEQSEVQQLQIEIVISQGHGQEILAQKELKVKDGLTLMDVMKDNFEIKDDDGFISAINGIQAEDGEAYAWIYMINGKDATVGAADYEIKNGDVIEFDFQSWK
ncbi:DUF4430 domain-containing protein [Paraliobacillus sp. JSM ZJ581]|uniref:DUF4430 domain-containing protein n=1 Tax=Paraliobacillus sp. JSM ZJ581 TaxID=3342118 RepID=UPI0035A8320E